MERQIRDEAANVGNIDTGDVRRAGADAAKQIADLEAISRGRLRRPDRFAARGRCAGPGHSGSDRRRNSVVTIDRNVAGDTAGDTLAHVGADNVLGGEAQGQLILSLFPDGGQVFNLQGTPGASPAIDRNAGLHNVLDGVAEQYPIVFEQTANFDPCGRPERDRERPVGAGRAAGSD
jgi:hypothetical protein